MGRRHALTVLTRLAQRRPAEAEWLRRMLTESLEGMLEEAIEVASETGDPLDAIVADLVAEMQDETLLAKAWAAARPEHVLTFVPLVPMASTARIAERRLRAVAREDDDDAERARIHALLGAFHAGRLDHAAAVEEWEAAATIQRRLAAVDPDAFTPDLAVTLCALAHAVSQVHGMASAQPAYQEALSRCRRALSGDPPVLDAALIHAVIGYANPEPDLKNPSLDRAIEILEPLDREGVEGVGPLLGDALYTRGLNGRTNDERIGFFGRAIACFRALEDDMPFVASQRLAELLVKQGELLAFQHRDEDAAVLFLEAHGVWRRLSDRDPDAFAVNFAFNCLLLHHHLHDDEVHARLMIDEVNDLAHREAERGSSDAARVAKLACEAGLAGAVKAVAAERFDEARRLSDDALKWADRMDDGPEATALLARLRLERGVARRRSGDEAGGWAEQIEAGLDLADGIASGRTKFEVQDLYADIIYASGKAREDGRTLDLANLEQTQGALEASHGLRRTIGETGMWTVTRRDGHRSVAPRLEAVSREAILHHRTLELCEDIAEAREAGCVEDAGRWLRRLGEIAPSEAAPFCSLARMLLEDGSSAEAEEVLRAAPRPVRDHPECKRLRLVAGFLSHVSRPMDGEPDAIDDAYGEAAVAFLQERWRDALEHLLTVARVDRDTRPEARPVALADVLEVVEDEQVAAAYRRRLASLLFS